MQIRGSRKFLCYVKTAVTRIDKQESQTILVKTPFSWQFCKCQFSSQKTFAKPISVCFLNFVCINNFSSWIIYSYSWIFSVEFSFSKRRNWSVLAWFKTTLAFGFLSRLQFFSRKENVHLGSRSFSSSRNHPWGAESSAESLASCLIHVWCHRGWETRHGVFESTCLPIVWHSFRHPLTRSETLTARNSNVSRENMVFR